MSISREKILITGADGMLGSSMPPGAIKLSRADLDVTDADAVMSACVKHRPTHVLHLAALTDLAFCEKNPAEAYAVNVAGTYHVALAARAVGAKLAYLSTSGVFDGTKGASYLPDDVPNPVNVYGHSKYLGELAVRGVLKDFLIVRASWLFGGGPEKDTKFVGKMLAQQAAGGEMRAVTDKRGSPTYAKDLAHALEDLLEKGASGIMHVAAGVATRYDVAREILSVTGSTAAVALATSAEFSLGYASGLDESMVSSIPMRPWRQALKEYIHEEWHGTITT